MTRRQRQYYRRTLRGGQQAFETHNAVENRRWWSLYFYVWKFAFNGDADALRRAGEDAECLPLPRWWRAGAGAGSVAVPTG